MNRSPLKVIVTIASLSFAMVAASQSGLRETIVRDLKKTESQIGSLKATVEIVHPTMPRTDGRAPRSGSFQWQSDGAERTLIEHQRYGEKSGELRLGDTVYRYFSTEMKAGPSPIVQAAKSAGEMTYANPAFCIGYSGSTYSELVALGAVTQSAPETAVIEGVRDGRAFRIVVSKAYGRWCMREVEAPFGANGRYFISSTGWVQLSDGTMVPTGGTFWAGGESMRSRRQDETFTVSDFRRTTDALTESSVMKAGTVVSAADGVYIFAHDGKLHLVRPTTKPAPGGVLREGSLSGRYLAVLTLGVASVLAVFALIRSRFRKKS